MNITNLPLEIIEKITLYLENIWDLECWLICAYMMENLKSIQTQRYRLTITSSAQEDKRRSNIVLNTKFISKNTRKRKLFEGIFGNYLLVDSIRERNLCFREWEWIFDEESYENFMEKYKHRWINKAPEKTKRYRKHLQ